MQGLCHTCKYRVPLQSEKGLCVRYPKVEEKAQTDWCGEYQNLATESPSKTVETRLGALERVVADFIKRLER